MSEKASTRVYLVEFDDGALVGFLMRRWSSFFDEAPPSAFGPDRESVLAQLDAKLQQRLANSGETPEMYLWKETFHTRTVRVLSRPATTIDRQPVIGKRELALKLTYAWCKTESGACRVMLPRFGWWIMLEDLETAPKALETALSSALLGAQSEDLYSFRASVSETVVEHRSEVVSATRRSDRGPQITRSVDDPGRFPTLVSVADDWIERSARNRLPKPVGERRSHRAAHLAKQPRSFLLLGESGVGKTTELHFLARQLMRERRAKQRVPGLWSTSADRLLAGMVYLGMWQERILNLVAELEDEDQLLNVGRLAPMVRPQSDGASIASLLQPAMARGSISIVAECTPRELLAARRANASFVDLFEIVEVPESKGADVLEWVRAYAARGEGRKTISAQAAKSAMRLLATYRRDARFPGKAFRFFDALRLDAKVPESPSVADIEESFSRQTGIPIELISDRHTSGFSEVRAKLERGVIGQPVACEAAARAIVPFKAGMNPPDRPLGTMLFVGPTGVGKTELAKQITRTLFSDSKRLIRVDMSEYSSPYSLSRLLESGDGVRSLAEAVRREPLSVVLFDEIEKAHPDVFDLLLAILGEGRLTDVEGRLVDFRMTLILMTSNLGVRDASALGFDASIDANDFRRGVRDHFRPEFLGRVDQLVPFAALTPAALRGIVDLQLALVERREGIRSKGLRLRVSDSAKDALASLGYSPRYGARPLKRVIESHVVTPIAHRIASHPSWRDVDVRIGVPGEAAEIFVSG